LLDDERQIPTIFDYQPSADIRKHLYNLICRACDTLGVTITNVVEHPEDYSVMYYFCTSGCPSYLKIYINNSGFVSYAKPMSMKGAEDSEFKLLIEEIQKHFV